MHLILGWQGIENKGLRTRMSKLPIRDYVPCSQASLLIMWWCVWHCGIGALQPVDAFRVLHPFHHSIAVFSKTDAVILDKYVLLLLLLLLLLLIIIIIIIIVIIPMMPRTPCLPALNRQLGTRQRNHCGHSSTPPPTKKPCFLLDVQ